MVPSTDDTPRRMTVLLLAPSLVLALFAVPAAANNGGCNGGGGDDPPPLKVVGLQVPDRIVIGGFVQPLPLVRNNTDEPLVANVSQFLDGDRFGDLDSPVAQPGETRTVGDGTELGWIPREVRDHEFREEALGGFLQDHLGRWYTAATHRLAHTAATTYYRELACATAGWLDRELARLRLRPEPLAPRPRSLADDAPPACGGCPADVTTEPAPAWRV